MMKEGLFPFQMAFSWLIHGGDPNYLPTGMISKWPFPWPSPPELFSLRALPSFPVTFIRGPAFRAGLRDGDEGLSSETEWRSQLL